MKPIAMHPLRAIRLAGIAVLLAASHAACAADIPYPELVLDDVKHVVTAPARWERDEWRDFGLSALAVVGTAALIDRPLRDEMRRHRGTDRTVRQVERFGAEYSLALLGGFYLVGNAMDNEKSIQVAQDGLAASLIASGLVTPMLKYATGRRRPYENAGTGTFKPFTNTNASFPSGHTTQAFAVAAVIADHYEETWITCASYSVAGLVGLARSYHDAHFASDIVAGAMIGTVVGKSVVAHNQAARSGRLALLPEVAPGRVGMRLAGQFQ